MNLEATLESGRISLAALPLHQRLRATFRRVAIVLIVAIIAGIGWMVRRNAFYTSGSSLGYSLGLIGGLDDAPAAALSSSQARALHARMGTAQVLVLAPYVRRDPRPPAGAVPLHVSGRLTQCRRRADLHAPRRRERPRRPLPVSQDSPWPLWQPRHAQGTATGPGERTQIARAPTQPGSVGQDTR